MSDFVTNLEQIATSQAQKEVTANQLFDAVSPASIFGRHAEACTGLTWGYYGGRWSGDAVANGTLELPASETNYIVMERATGLVVVDTPSDALWDDTENYAHLYVVTTGPSTVTAWEDHRAGENGVIGSSAAGGGGGAVSDGDKGDVVVSGGGTVWSIDSGVLSTFGRSLVDDTTAAAARATLGIAAMTDGQLLVGQTGSDPLPKTVSGDATVSAAGAVTVANNAISYAKMQDVSATARAIGRNTAGSGDPEEVTLSQILDWIGSAAQGDILYRGASAWSRRAAGTDGKVLRTNGAGADPTWDYPHECLIVAVGDEVSGLTTGTAKVTFRMPYAFTLTAVRGSLTTAQASGSIFTVDINESGTTVLSTKLTLDNTEKTSTTAATAAVISDASLADDAEMTVDIDQIGNGTAAGLKIYLIGRRT